MANNETTELEDTDGLPTIENVPATPSAYQPTLITPAPISPNGNGQLTNDQYLNSQIQSGQDHKFLTAQQGDIKAQGELAQANLSQQAADNDRQKAVEQEQAWNKAKQDIDLKSQQERKQIELARAESVDPDRLWNSKSTAGKIESVMSVFLSGFGESLAGRGGNPALQMLNQAIDRDIDSQKHHIDNNWKAISEMHGLNQDASNQAIHDQEWRSGFRNRALEAVKLDLASRAQSTNSELTKNNALLGVQAITDEQNKLMNDRYKLGQQALLAGQNAQLAAQKKQEELAKEYRTELSKQVETAKTNNTGETEQEIQQRLLGENGPYRDLVFSGRAPQAIAQKEFEKNKLLASFQEKVNTLNKTAGVPMDKAAQIVLEHNPEYSSLMQTDNGYSKPLPGKASTTKEDKKQEEKDRIETNLIKDLDSYSNPEAIKKLTSFGIGGYGVGQGKGGQGIIDTHQDVAQYREVYNSNANRLAASMTKDADGRVPTSPEAMRELGEPFRITPLDTEASAARKIESLKQKLALYKGVDLNQTSSTPNPAATTDPKKMFKSWTPKSWTPDKK